MSKFILMQHAEGFFIAYKEEAKDKYVASEVFQDLTKDQTEEAIKQFNEMDDLDSVGVIISEEEAFDDIGEGTVLATKEI